MSLLVTGLSWRDQKRAKLMQVYNPETKNWTEISLKTPEEMQFCVALLQNQLIFIADSYPRKLVRYDISSGTWPPIRKESVDDQEKAVIAGRTFAVFKGQLYAIGGVYANYKCSDRVDCWDPVTDTWTRVAHLKSARSWAESTVMGDCLYVTGGRNGKWLRHTECYSFTTREWKRLADLNEERTIFGFTGANGYLYAVGGSNENGYLSSVERYDVKAKKWATICALQKPLCYVASVFFESRLWAIGGFSSVVPRCEIEQYDVERNEWAVAAPLKTGMRAKCFECPATVAKQLMRCCEV